MTTKKPHEDEHRDAWAQDPKWIYTVAEIMDHASTLDYLVLGYFRTHLMSYRTRRWPGKSNARGGYKRELALAIQEVWAASSVPTANAIEKSIKRWMLWGALQRNGHRGNYHFELILRLPREWANSKRMAQALSSEEPPEGIYPADWDDLDEPKRTVRAPSSGEPPAPIVPSELDPSRETDGSSTFTGSQSSVSPPDRLTDVTDGGLQMNKQRQRAVPSPSSTLDGRSEVGDFAAPPTPNRKPEGRGTRMSKPRERDYEKRLADGEDPAKLIAEVQAIGFTVPKALRGPN